MIKEVILAKIGLTMETGTIVSWLKKEGDYVEQGDELLEVETDKVTTVVEAFHPGYLKKILVAEGQEAPVNTVIACIGEKDDDIDAFMDKTKDKDQIESVTAVSAKGERGSVSQSKTRVKINASPLAKRLAADLGVDLAIVKGTGPDGRVGKEDVLAAANKIASEDKPSQTQESKYEIKIFSEKRLTGIKKLVAERMKASYSDAPHIYLELSVDMTSAAALRDRLNKNTEDGKHITYTDIIVRAVTEVLKKHRLLNATLRGDSIVIFEDINIGIAASTDKGLVVPVIKNTDKLDLAEISAACRNQIDKVRQGKQSIEDVSNGTFTITNLGMFGIESFKPILNPGQSAILAVGMIKDTPVAGESGQVVLRPMMSISLACDHRVVDGVYGASFLSELKEILENSDAIFT